MHYVVEVDGGYTFLWKVLRDRNLFYRNDSEKPEWVEELIAQGADFLWTNLDGDDIVTWISKSHNFYYGPSEDLEGKLRWIAYLQALKDRELAKIKK